MATITIPDGLNVGSVELVVNMSGGKDSTALRLAMLEAGLECRSVFADTGWEAPETYAYLDLLREKVGPIDIVKDPRGMLGIAREKAGFPMRRGRWCTEKLKIAPLRDYFDSLILQGLEPVSVVGIRAEESEARAKMPVFEDSDVWGGPLWRPILAWSVDDVIQIHHRHGVPMNPLYYRGHSRVGCYPCIMESKDSIRLIAEYSPERIDEIRREEAAHTEARASRNADGSGKFSHPQSTFFSPKTVGMVSTIDEVVSWSHTTNGGHQLPLIQDPPDGGCFRWGICEPPAKEEES